MSLLWQTGVRLNTVSNAVTVNFSTSATVNITNEDKDTPQMNVPAGSNAEVVFLGNTWTVQLVQIHWHHSSEHRLDNVSYNAEAHLVTKIVQSGKVIFLTMETRLFLCLMFCKLAMSMSAYCM